MSKKGGKGAVETAPPPPTQPVDTTASDLLQLYAQERGKQRLDLVEFTHAKYNDWLRYFGFSMEREIEWQQATQTSHRKHNRPLRATISLMGTQQTSTVLPNVPLSHPGASGATAGATATTAKVPQPEVCPFESNTAVDSACWTLAPTGYATVDEYALGLGALLTSQTTLAVTEQCIQPYKQVTWRLNEYSCQHYKLRSIYRWLCHNMKVTFPVKASTGPTVTIQEPAAVAGGKDAKKAPAPPPKKGGAVDATQALPVSNANPNDTVLISRTADPIQMAHLFAQMCGEAGIECEVVKGTLKGCLDQLGKPFNFVPWAWNIVKALDPSGNVKQYLVDLALSTMYVFPYEGSGAPGRRIGTPGSGSAANPSASPPAPSAPPSTSTTSSPKYLDLATGTKVFEPFYYFTDPKQFAPLHFPDDFSKSLLQHMVTKTQWEVAPRLSHEFFALKLRLDSHRRRALFTAKSTPIYVTVFADELKTTDLTCKVYRGQPSQVDFYASEPIDAKYVWQQREEKERRVTFSMMVPDVGYYTIAIGGRSNPPLGGAQFPQGCYTPAVLVYQVLINFVSVNETLFPLQHMSPTIAKITEPLNHKVLLGAQRVSVVPMVPNVMAIGVVNRIYKPPGASTVKQEAVAAPVVDTPRGGKKPPPKEAKKDTTEVVAAAPVAVKPSKPEIERVTMELLPLNADKAVFEGAVNLQVGLMEIWAFYGDPTSVSVGGGAASANSAKPANVEPQGEVAAPGALPPAPSPPPAAANVAIASPNAAPKPTTLKPSGTFLPLVTEIQVVKRIPTKEQTLNDGVSLIQPLPMGDSDRPVVLQMLTEPAGAAEVLPVAFLPDPSRNLVPGQMHCVGGYFASKK